MLEYATGSIQAKKKIKLEFVVHVSLGTFLCDVNEVLWNENVGWERRKEIYYMKLLYISELNIPILSIVYNFIKVFSIWGFFVKMMQFPYPMVWFFSSNRKYSKKLFTFWNKRQIQLVSKIGLIKIEISQHTLLIIWMYVNTFICLSLLL